MERVIRRRRPMSEATKAKIAAAHLGKTCDEATKVKIAETLKARQATINAALAAYVANQK